jgi:hypothetical protein
MPSPVPPETQVCSKLVIGEGVVGAGRFRLVRSLAQHVRDGCINTPASRLIQAVYAQPVTRTRPILRDHPEPYRIKYPFWKAGGNSRSRVIRLKG